MIISHEHKYLFVELPRTGTTAIAKELIENYKGEKILTKHAHYDDFLKQASNEEKNYFVFSCIRNPIDRTLTRYYKLKTKYMNPKEDIARFRRQGRRVRLQTYYLYLQYKFIQNKNASFSQYIKRFYFFPYDDWSLKHHQNFDFIIRFENLSEDFDVLLEKLGVEKVRDLPLVNKTPSKEKSYLEILKDADEKTKKRVKHVFGYYMLKWGYKFPASWGEFKLSNNTKFQLKVLNFFRKVYWRYLK